VIARLRGRVVERIDDRVVVDVQGVGYLVHVDARTARDLELDTEVTLHVSTRVKEDAITLYGFDDAVSRLVFERLVGVSGVGPATGLSILGTLSVEEIVRAVEQEDTRSLSKVKGIGPRTAKRVCLDLKGKLPAAIPFAPLTARGPARPADPLPLALAGLGYKRSEIDQALAELERAGLAEATTQERLGASLSFFSRSE